MPKSKESTARISMFHELKIPYVFTLEASFAGANRGNLNGHHFSIGDLENVGKAVLKCLYQAKCLEYDKPRLKEIQIEIDKIQLERGDNGNDYDSSSEDGDKLDEI